MPLRSMNHAAAVSFAGDTTAPERPASTHNRNGRPGDRSGRWGCVKSIPLQGIDRGAM